MNDGTIIGANTAGHPDLLGAVRPAKSPHIRIRPDVVNDASVASKLHGRAGVPAGFNITWCHALTDGEGRPLRFLLTGGQVADCRAVDVLLNDLAAGTIVLGDKAYDSNAIRDLIERQGAVPNIPSKANRRWKSCFSKTLYKGRNAVERMFGRFKDYRRIATRYDKLATNFLGAIYLAAAVTWWL